MFNLDDELAAAEHVVSRGLHKKSDDGAEGNPTA